MSEKPRVRVASYLSPPDFRRLDWACRPVRDAYREHAYGVYLVGSVITRPDFRDVDLRMICDDETYAAMIPNERVGLLLNVALSDLIARAANLPWPVDFQIQSMTEANTFSREEGLLRNPMGVR